MRSIELFPHRSKNGIVWSINIGTSKSLELREQKTCNEDSGFDVIINNDGMRAVFIGACGDATSEFSYVFNAYLDTDITSDLNSIDGGVYYAFLELIAKKQHIYNAMIP